MRIKSLGAYLFAEVNAEVVQFLYYVFCKIVGFLHLSVFSYYIVAFVVS